ncbi:c-type cytochrome [Pseudochryseolinea flava]|uniref:Cytochrome c n=1 Tax=Pseudochryseolinea flava TaxID=2059302 RepID=A0A364XXY8_9BACT|nr:cytochrome c [Pseudochryseolinea flava]RAV99344.1 cytochrome c [Pseudochryseolinea flava]
MQRSSIKMITTVALMTGCWVALACSRTDNNHSADADKKTRDTSAKFTQYYNRGEELYQQHCSNCHQVDGSGLGLLFPPLNKSDYLDKNLDDVLCLMRYGKSGELIVNGKQFNKEMKGIATLSDLEIAEIATYIYNTWENDRGLIEVSYVSNAMQTCETQR